MGQKKGNRLSIIESWESEESPGYLEMANGRFRQHRMWNGKSINRYFIKTKCSQCDTALLQDYQNSKKNKNTFCDIECRNTFKRANRIKKVTRKGYSKLVTMVCVEGHPLAEPMANNVGRVAEHRLVMCEHLGRPLTSEEHVHHINLDKLDNSLENLVIIQGNAKHHKVHGALNRQISKLIKAGVLTFDKATLKYTIDWSKVKA